MTELLPYVIWIIEDNVVFREALSRALGTAPGLAPPQAFVSAEAALAALSNQPAPDLFLLDVGLPGIDGLSAIPQLRAAAPAAAVVVLTVFVEEEKIFQALCSGASGYLEKSASIADILAAIDEIRAGGAPMTPQVARRVLQMFARFSPPTTNYGLTSREKDILQLMIEGLVKKQIASRLGVSIHTVDTHMRRIYDKLHVNTCTAAVAKAVKERLV